MSALGLKRMVLVQAQSSSGRAAATALEEGLWVAGIQVADKVNLRPDGSDADAAAQQVHKANGQAVLLATSGRATAAMLLALAGGHDVGMPLLQVYGMSSAASQSDLLSLGTKARGFSITQVIPLPRDSSVQVVAKFLTAMRSQPGTRTYTELEGCIGPLVLAEVLRKKPGDLNRAGMLKALRAVGRIDLGGFEVDLADKAKRGSRFTDIVYVGSDGRIAR